VLNLRDDIELSVLAETGDVHAAEAVGIALDVTWRMLCDVCGVPYEAVL
jgi:hypothetical protein